MEGNIDAPPPLPNPLNRLRLLVGEKRVLFLDDSNIRLSPAETRLFASLQEGRGEVVRHEELLRAVFPDAPPPKGNVPKALATAIQGLDKKLGRLRGKDGLVIQIESQRGVGYRLSYKVGT